MVSISKGTVSEQVSTMDFSKFIVTTDLSSYQFVEDFPLSDLQAKHIIIRNEETEPVYREAISAGHPYIMWGATRGGTVESERAIIDKMIADDFVRPIRITVTSEHIWSDNNHTTISYLLRGHKKVSEVPHYIVDCRNYPQQACVLAADERHIFWNNIAITDAIRRAYRLQLLENAGGRKTPWTIGNLIKQIQ